MEKEFLEKIKKEYYPQVDWEFHIKPVMKFADELANKLNADKEIIEYAAFLHDIGRIKFGPENHDITSANEAEKILIKEDMPKDKVDAIVHCIKSHRGSQELPTETIEAEIIRNADALAQYNILPWFFVETENTAEELKKEARWVKEKYDRNWNKKLTLPEAKELVRKKHEAINLILDSFINI